MRILSGSAAVLVVVAVVGAGTVGRDVGGDATPASATTRGGVADSAPIRCRVGERPGYFVPAHSPPALLGCARLGQSGKRVDFSGSLDRIDGDMHLCINPAYSGRGQRGIYIPGLCKLNPRPSRFAVRDASQPRQAVDRYEYVIWGTAPRRTEEIFARFASGTARAAIFRVPSTRAPWTFGTTPFALFVVELPLAAACGTVAIDGDGLAAPERIHPQRKLCARAGK
jgi:hypothetical protein